MIIIALGANLPSHIGTPAQSLRAAQAAMEERRINITSKAGIWLSAPVPYTTDQEWYHNSVVAVETEKPPQALLDDLLDIEQEFGRVRSIKNAPRILDLDLIAYNDQIVRDGTRLIVPHPRMHERLFVLKPLEEISDKWVHPKTGQNVAEMIQSINDPEQQIKRMQEA